MRVLPGPDHAHHVRDAVERGARDAVDTVLDRILYPRVQRGADQVAVAGHLFLADAGARQVIQHVVAEERAVPGRDAAPGQRLGLRQNSQRLRFGGAQRVRLRREVLNHRVQHQIPALQGTVGIGVGVQRCGRLHHAGQQRGLLPVQLRCVGAEVRLRGVLNTERAVAERHQVEIAGEDLRLGEGLVKRERHPDLTQLARRGGFDGGTPLRVGLRGHQQLVVLHILLLDRRAASGFGVAGCVAGQTGQCALPVDAVVLGESLVLDRDDRQLHRVGDLLARDLESTLGVQPRDRVARRVDHGRDLWDVALHQLRRAVGHHIGRAVGHQTQPAGEREHERRRHHRGEQTAPRQLDDRYHGWRAFRHGYRLLTVARPSIPGKSAAKTFARECLRSIIGMRVNIRLTWALSQTTAED